MGIVNLKHTTEHRNGLGTFVRKHRMQSILAIRVTIAALVAFALAHVLQLPLPLWTVLTAVIVTQVSVGRSIKATFDYLLGTFGGALYGCAVGVLIPHSSEFAVIAVLAIVVGPLALVASTNPRFTVAPITGIIVLLFPLMTHATQIASALERVQEVALGGVIGFIISILFLPSNAHPIVSEAAARTLDQIAQALGELLAGLAHGLDMDALHRIQDGIGHDLAQLNIIATEAEYERRAGLAIGPKTGPLLSTLLRLRHDLVMIGRTAVRPLPEAFRTRLEAPLASASLALSNYLRASGATLKARRDPPSLDSVESAIEAYAEEVAAIRREGLTQPLPNEAAERFFTLGFALEQMHNDSKDLQRSVREWAWSSQKAGRKTKPAH
jgi:uncharacterized membrane protein YccC